MIVNSFIFSGLVITFVILMIIPYALLCSARVASSIHNYGAPLDLYNHLYRNELGRKSQREVNVCLGKEWYRFGSSFFIPSNKQHVQFIKSGFDGLLPQVLTKLFIHCSLSRRIQEHGRFLSI